MTQKRIKIIQENNDGGSGFFFFFFFFGGGGGSGTDTGKLLTVEEKGDRTPPFCFHSGSTE